MIYFRRYRDVIDKDPPRVLRTHLIHQPMIKRTYAECTPLYQLIKLINIMKTDPSDTVFYVKLLKTVNRIKNRIKKSFLNAYDSICRIENCFVCNL